MLKDYYSLSNSEDVLVADGIILSVLIGTGKMDLLTGIYKKIYTTPQIYAECQKTFDINSLKSFRSLVLQKDFPASKAGIASIRELSESLTEDDAYAMLCGMVEKMDVVMDDPIKAKIYSSHSVNVRRLSDIVSAGAITKKQKPA